MGRNREVIEIYRERKQRLVYEKSREEIEQKRQVTLYFCNITKEVIQKTIKEQVL